MKIALVFDDLTQFGGAERLLLAALEIWPEAPLYTTLISKEWREKLEKAGKKVMPSFLNKFPFKKTLNKFYAALGFHILAMESFDFSDFDIVLSFSSRYAHGIVTKSKTKHVCYMNSPGRMIWDSETYFEKLGLWKYLKELFLYHQRLWDYSSSHRVDFFIANSRVPQKRIKKFYGMDSVVINPFCDDGICDEFQKDGSHFLVISRLLPWKKIDIAIKACADLNVSLKVIGEGPYKKQLEKISSPYENIEMLGYVSESEKAKLISSSIALIHPQYEDFGIVPVEVMSCGKPVIAYKGGGAMETVVEGVTGEFFHPQDVGSLKAAIRKFDASKYRPSECFYRSQEFTKKKFQTKLRTFIDDVYLKKV